MNNIPQVLEAEMHPAANSTTLASTRSFSISAAAQALGQSGQGQGLVQVQVQGKSCANYVFMIFFILFLLFNG